MDDEGFISIGTIDVNLGDGVDEVTVVVKVSSAGAERRAGRPTVLMADAVRIENLDQ